MGEFSFLKADITNNQLNILTGVEGQKLLLPPHVREQTGLDSIPLVLNGYGCFTFEGKQFDLFELLAVWNKDAYLTNDLYRYAPDKEGKQVGDWLTWDGKDLMKGDPITLTPFPKADETKDPPSFIENRILGIHLMYDEDGKNMLFPLKIVNSKVDRLYEDIKGSSFDDPNQGWDKFSARSPKTYFYSAVRNLYRASLAGNGARAEKLANNSYTFARMQAACACGELGERTALRLARDANPAVRQVLAMSQGLAENVQEELLRQGGMEEYLCYNPSLCRSVIEELLKSEDRNVLRKLSSNENLTGDDLAVLAGTKDRYVLDYVSSHRNLKKETAQEIFAGIDPASEDSQWHYLYLAQNKNTPGKVLKAIAAMSDEEGRHSAAGEAKITLQLLEKEKKQTKSFQGR